MLDPTKPSLISETALKKRRTLEELAIRRSETVGRQVKRPKIIRGDVVKIKRPEMFVTEARTREGSQNKFNRRKKDVERKSKSDLVPKNTMKDTVGFMVRIHHGRNASSLIKEKLNGLKLLKKYDATFTKLDREAIANLKPLDAYIAYGYISQKSVIELVHRRAYITKDDGTRCPLSDNITVEELLGDKNIICLSDLSHEIFHVGDNFQAAVEILSTFQLSDPVGHYEKKVLKLHDGVEKLGGFIGDEMEFFLNKIL